MVQQSHNGLVHEYVSSVKYGKMSTSYNSLRRLNDSLLSHSMQEGKRRFAAKCMRTYCFPVYFGSAKLVLIKAVSPFRLQS